MIYLQVVTTHFPCSSLTQSVVNEPELVLSLDKEGSLVPDVREEGGDVDLPLGSELLQHGVYHDVGSCSAHTGAAVNQQRPLRFL